MKELHDQIVHKSLFATAFSKPIIALSQQKKRATVCKKTASVPN